MKAEINFDKLKKVDNTFKFSPSFVNIVDQMYEDEIKILNRIVTAYLEFAELQAIRHVSMYMSYWIKKLDDFIKLSGSKLGCAALRLAATP